ncbi:MAG: hypothetical protein WCJ37_03650 [Syntrophus sp. (in: bacteria)]
MKKARIIAIILGLLVETPIWYYLVYQVLVRVNATELMFFLFWIYVPVSLTIYVIQKIAAE